MTRLAHPIPPVFDENSELLILGSFPSEASRESGFYYGHLQNRFWRVLAAAFETDIPVGNRSKRDFLLRNHIALWDVIESCEITGSADSSVRNVIPNDIGVILRCANIRKIIANGRLAAMLYDRYILPETGIPTTYLPSTSPANASWQLQRLIDIWKPELALLK